MSRRNKLAVIRVRITQAEAQAIRQYAAQRGTTAANVIREKLRRVRFDTTGYPIYDLATVLEDARRIEQT